MKTLNGIGVFLFTTILLLISCSLDDENVITDLNSNDNQFSRASSNDKMVTVPFKSNFYTVRNYDNIGEGFCTEDPYLSFNYQVGEGEATHLGSFTTTMSFCGDGFDYKNGEGVFIAANGDELYIKIPSEGELGHILPYDHPIYELQFHDPFSFNGGTGRFDGATGGGYTNSFVDLFDNDGNFIPEHRTDHKWTGTITLKPGINSN